MSADGTAGLPNSIITRPRVRRQSTAYRGTAAAASRCALDRAGGTLATSGAAWRERCQPTGLPSRRRCQPAGASLATAAIDRGRTVSIAYRQRLRYVVSSCTGGPAQASRLWRAAYRLAIGIAFSAWINMLRGSQGLCMTTAGCGSWSADCWSSEVTTTLIHGHCCA